MLQHANSSLRDVASRDVTARFQARWLGVRRRGGDSEWHKHLAQLRGREVHVTAEGAARVLFLVEPGEVCARQRS
eukprot:1656793-Rhodomonas_salina.6